MELLKHVALEHVAAAIELQHRALTIDCESRSSCPSSALARVTAGKSSRPAITLAASRAHSPPGFGSTACTRGLVSRHLAEPPDGGSTAVLYYACLDIWGNGGRSRFCGNNSWILSSSCKWAVLAHVFLSGEGADSRHLFTKFLWVRGTRSLPAATRPQPVHSRSSLTTPSAIEEEEACRFASRVLRYSLPAFVQLVTLKVKTRPSWNFSISFPDIATSFPWHYGPPPTRGV